MLLDSRHLQNLGFFTAIGREREQVKVIPWVPYLSDAGRAESPRHKRITGLPWPALHTGGGFEVGLGIIMAALAISDLREVPGVHHFSALRKVDNLTVGPSAIDRIRRLVDTAVVPNEARAAAGSEIEPRHRVAVAENSLQCRPLGFEQPKSPGEKHRFTVATNGVQENEAAELGAGGLAGNSNPTLKGPGIGWRGKAGDANEFSWSPTTLFVKPKAGDLKDEGIRIMVPLDKGLCSDLPNGLYGVVRNTDRFARRAVGIPTMEPPL